jgi:hypothetical protein
LLICVTQTKYFPEQGEEKKLTPFTSGSACFDIDLVVPCSRERDEGQAGRQKRHQLLVDFKSLFGQGEQKKRDEILSHSLSIPVHPSILVRHFTKEGVFEFQTMAANPSYFPFFSLRIRSSRSPSWNFFRLSAWCPLNKD